MSRLGIPMLLIKTVSTKMIIYVWFSFYEEWQLGISRAVGGLTWQEHMSHAGSASLRGWYLPVANMGLGGISTLRILETLCWMRAVWDLYSEPRQGQSMSECSSHESLWPISDYSGRVSFCNNERLIKQEKLESSRRNQLAKMFILVFSSLTCWFYEVDFLRNF